MILIINGPNLNLLGKREPDIYGKESFEDFLNRLKKEFPEEKIEYFQSNSEGAIIDAIHASGYNPDCRGIIINPGAYSHYSIAIADALGSIPIPAIEVHISNIHAREEYRRTSVTAEKTKGVIAGLGLQGYRLALLHIIVSNGRMPSNP